MASASGNCLVARALPSTNSNEKSKNDEIIQSLSEQLDGIALEKCKDKISPTKGECKGSTTPMSPTEFVKLQSLRSSAIAQKMSTTSRVTSDRDARRTLFADLMLDTNSDKNVDVEGIANLKEVEKLTIKENEGISKSKKADEKKTKLNNKDENESGATVDKEATLERESEGEKLSEEREGSHKKIDEATTNKGSSNELISRGPIRFYGHNERESSFYHPYSLENNGAIAPQTSINDLSGYNSYIYTYHECGPDSCDTFSDGSSPDVNDSRSEVPTPPQQFNTESELPEVLSDFILKYSRRYTPSPDGCRSEETETSNWIDSPYSSTASHTTGSPCNSPASGVSAPNGSPNAPRGGQTPISSGRKGKFTPPKQTSVDSAFSKHVTVTKNRPAKERLCALVQSNDMDEAWAWVIQCLQHHSGSLYYLDSDNDTLLHIVCQHMDLAKVYAFVEQVLKTEYKDPTNPTTIKIPSFFDSPNLKGLTPLFIAVEKHQNEVIDYLLEAGASPNSFNANKDTPLHYAAARGLTKITQTICSYKSTNINSINGLGLTPLLFAFKTHGMTDRAGQKISNIGVIQVLLKHDADPTIGSSANGKTIIHYSVEHVQPELLEILHVCLSEKQLMHVANKLDFEGRSPLAFLDSLSDHISPQLRSRLATALFACGAKQMV